MWHKKGIMHCCVLVMRGTLPLAALQSPFNVQTQEQTHHDQWWTSTQLNVWWSRLKFNYQWSYFTRQSPADIANASLYTKYQHVVDSDSTEHPLVLLGQSRSPSDGWEMHSYHAHTVDAFMVFLLPTYLSLTSMSTFLVNFLPSSWYHLGTKGLTRTNLVSWWWRWPSLIPAPSPWERSGELA